MSRKASPIEAVPDVHPAPPPPPKGLGEAGIDLWQRLVSEYDFSEAPEKELILAEAARTADMIAKLQRIVDAAGDELRVKGSQGQPVALPEISELRQHRAQLAGLLGRSLSLPSGDEDSEGLSRSDIGRLGAAARWKNR
jgi:hypothetical protein